jgi:molybdopterin-binding protein
MSESRLAAPTRIRVGQAAEMLGVTVETLRRWETEGRLTMERSEGGQRLVAVEEISRLLDERRRASAARPIVAQSARNHFPGIVTRIERDRVAAVVEVQAGPHRLVSLMTAEAVDDLDLKVGDEAICTVKSTNVVVEIPSAREPRS